MPNYCNYGMKIKGKKENVNKLIDYIKADYDYNKEEPYCSEEKHFFRMFECEVYEKTIIEDDKEYSCEAYGYCAWSIYSCMFKGDSTYYNGFKDREKFFATDIVTESKLLDLEIEIFSEESGVGFMEHYLIDKGKLLINDCIDYIETYDEETDEYETEGGLEWNFSI